MTNGNGSLSNDASHDEDSPSTLSLMDGGDGSNDNDDDDDDVRIGSISSARFNILSTMVGGGCLSLPMAFQLSGNALIGPVMLLVTGVITEFCFRTLVVSAVRLNEPHRTRPGKDTFESITSAAFGSKAYVFSMGLVVLMCFFGTVGYAVLLRDMMAPLNRAIAPHGFGSEWFRHNFTMFLVILLVTPFCTLRRLTALKDCGLASMMSLLILGSCIVFRSVQCNCNNSSNDNNQDPWYTTLTFFPESWRDLLDALPLFISCFVCHYNILPVHNELKDPSPARVSRWLRSTTWFAVALYMIMGFAGSAYAPCTPTGKISGSKYGISVWEVQNDWFVNSFVLPVLIAFNPSFLIRQQQLACFFCSFARSFVRLLTIGTKNTHTKDILLDFDENDPLLMVGRMCLAVTITLAFPMLVIPGRDIVVRSLILPRLASVSSGDSITATATAIATSSENTSSNTTRAVTRSVDEELQESLLASEEYSDEQQQEQPLEIDNDNDNDEVNPNEATASRTANNNSGNNNNNASTSSDLSSASSTILLCTSVILFWSAGSLASVVSSIDVVWDLLGSSLSILMSYLIPASTYLVITKQCQQQQQDSNNNNNNNDDEGWIAPRVVCWLLLSIFVPLMFISTINAVYNTFF